MLDGYIEDEEAIEDAVDGILSYAGYQMENINDADENAFVD